MVTELVNLWVQSHLAISITVEDILKNVGRSDEEISKIHQEALRATYLDGVLSV